MRWIPACLGAIVTLSFMAGAAQARPARCYSSQEGHYRCDFRAAGRDGSFVISARGKPTFMVNIADRPGVAFVHADFGTERCPARALSAQRRLPGLLGVRGAEQQDLRLVAAPRPGRPGRAESLRAAGAEVIARRRLQSSVKNAAQAG